jgi:hypothetical protein
MDVLPWLMCVALGVLALRFRRERDKARSNARRVWRECQAGITRVKAQIGRLEAR